MERLNMKNIYSFLSFIVTIISLAAGITGCNGPESGRYGVQIPEEAPVLSLAQILESPHIYDGEKLVVKGVIAGQCASLCEFFLRDGVHRATIYPQGYKLPKLTIGKTVRAYVLVTSGEEHVVFSALGLKIE
jgi:hypothetical protein